jgi:methyl-accepting chemotaxis protein
MFKNLKIGMKLGVGFTLVLLILTITSVMSIKELMTLNDGVDYLVKYGIIKLNAMNAVLDNVNEITVIYYQFRGLLAKPNIKIINDLLDKIKKSREKAADAIKEYTDLVNDPRNMMNDEKRANQKKFNDGRAQFLKMLDDTNKLIDECLVHPDVLELTRGPDGFRTWDTVREVMNYDFIDASSNYINIISELIAVEEKQLTNIGEEIDEGTVKFTIVSIVISILGIVFGIIIAFVITISITKPVQHCLEVAQAISEGDMSIELDYSGKDEIGALGNAMKKMIASIRNLVDDIHHVATGAKNGKLSTRANISLHKGRYSEIIEGFNETLDSVTIPLNEAMQVMESIAHKNLTVRVVGQYKGDMLDFTHNLNEAVDNLDKALSLVDISVDQISSASTEISSSTQALAGATSQQAASIEEISASLEEVNSLTGSNADNARLGLKLADQAVLAVDDGNDAMDKMNKAMDAILNSSQQTSKIIKTIDEIAFQTNLLALNAAVEAAHAGEAGKGFAVVAEEVKSLALRSAEAAKNTNVLIDEAGKNSSVGSQIVEQVSKSFQEMKDQFNKVKSIVNEISSSSDEQSTGVDQISTGVHEMSRVTQMNAASTEESAAAAEELNSQTDELKKMLSTFKVSRNIQNIQRITHSNKKNVNKQSKNTVKQPVGYEMKADNILPLDSLDDDDFETF